MPAHKIDFRYIRENADIIKIVEHFGLSVEKDGTKPGQFKCLCPFHEDTHPSLKLNAEKNIYHCFSCEAGGNVLDFVMALEGIEIRPAAKLVAEICKISTSGGNGGTGTKGRKQSADRPSAKPSAPAARHGSQPSKPVEIEESKTSAANDNESEGHNPPLTFELKNLKTDHPWLKERGITKQMIEIFGLGIASKGLMKDRLVFPIHDAQGRLVAYCGRYVGDEVPEREPKYKQPPRFRKELELFNWHRVEDIPSDTALILVESFFSVVKLHTLEIDDGGMPRFRVVSPMGRSLSDRQIQMIKEASESQVTLLFDGDDPGRAAVTTVGRQLLDAGVKVSAPMVPASFKPHRMDVRQLLELLG